MCKPHKDDRVKQRDDEELKRAIEESQEEEAEKYE